MEFAQFWQALLSPPLMLALVATVGYWIGRRRLTSAGDERARSRQEIMRALAVAQELESITNRLKKSLSSQVPAVAKFNSRLSRLEESDNFAWQELSERANELLKPALRLSTEISNAHASILQQMTQLSLFAELRTDPLTGASNRRAFDDSLDGLVKQHARFGAPVSLAMLDIDFFKRINDQRGHLQGDIVLRELAELLTSSVRECDMVARYGGEEFAIVMPQTQLAPAIALAERVRASVEEQLPVTVSIGVAGLVDGDTASTFVHRADAALYLAKVNGRNRVYAHEGETRIVPASLVANNPSIAPTVTSSKSADESNSHDDGAPELVECHKQQV